MASVYNEYRVPAQHLEPGGPAGGQQAPADRLAVQLPALAPQHLHGLQHHGGVLHLVLAHQGDAHVRPILIGEALPGQIELLGDDLAEIGVIQRRILLRAHLLKHPVRLRIAAVQDHAAAGLDDARLGPGDIGHGGPQLRHVVQTHGRDDGDLRHVDDIGGVQLAAHAHLQHHDFAPAPGEPDHGQGGHQLKLRGGVLHGPGVGEDILRQLRQLLVGNLLPVDLHPLVEAVDIWRGVQSRAVA